jgi:hypothetical protein
MVQALTEDDSIRSYASAARTARTGHRRGTTVMNIAWPTRSPACSSPHHGNSRSPTQARHYDRTLQLAVAAGADEALSRRVAELSRRT